MESEPRRTAHVTLLLSSPHVLLALGFGVGLVPWAPGTAGSLVAIPLALALKLLPLLWQFVIWGILCALGVWICDRAARKLGFPDHPAIVWDEICGMTIILMLCPDGPGWVIAGFAAFRFFDILKPWPIDIVDRRLPNGFGAMGDDLLAAAYAIAAIGVAEWLIEVAAP